VRTRPNQSALSFKAIVDAGASTKTIAIRAGYGDSAVEENVSVEASPRPSLSVPGKQFAAFGKKLSFPVSAISGAGAILSLSASPLPAGASFDPSTGLFDWTPGDSQSGTYAIGFSAADSAGGSSTAEAAIQTGSGSPVIEALENAATGSQDAVCSSGSLATLRGGWLSPGTRVTVNGESAGVVFASPTRVTFRCPSGPAGASFSVALETDAGRAGPIAAALRESAPGILTIDGSTGGQAAAQILDGTQIAVPRNYHVRGQPAQSGDMLRIPVTGLPADVDPKLIAVEIGGLELIADSVQPVPEIAGVVSVSVTLPRAAQVGDDIPVLIHRRLTDGSSVSSQKTTIAIEANQ
jgi:uncharacterized protein (TIGR03437 family)